MIYINSRIPRGQRIRSIVLHYILVLREVQSINSLAVNDKCREYIIGIPYTELCIRHLGYLYHYRGQPLVVVQQLITRTYRLYRQIGEIKITAHRCYPFLLLPGR